MHIALLTNFLPPDEEYGIPRYVDELAYALTERGHIVEVISGSLRKDVKSEMRNGFRVHWIYNNIKSAKWLPALKLLNFSFKVWRLLSNLHRKEPFDIVEYPNLTFPGIITIVMGLSEPKPELIVRLSSPTHHFPISGILPWRITEFLEKYQATHSTAYIGNTNENLHVCGYVYELHENIPHCVILHGVPRGSVPELYYHKDGRNLVLYMGRIEPRKGFDILVKAWALVVTTIPDAKLIVAGEDRVWSGGLSYYDWSVSQVDKDIQDNINYLGFVDSKTKESLYRECDIFVAPSRYESFGLVFLEAMRYGKPVVSCEVGGIPEVVSNEKTGLLVPPENEKKLANAIIRLLNDNDLRCKMGMAAIKDLSSTFTQEQVAIKTEAFYKELLTDNRG